MVSTGVPNRSEEFAIGAEKSTFKVSVSGLEVYERVVTFVYIRSRIINSSTLSVIGVVSSRLQLRRRSAETLDCNASKFHQNRSDRTRVTAVQSCRSSSFDLRSPHDRRRRPCCCRPRRPSQVSRRSTAYLPANRTSSPNAAFTFPQADSTQHVTRQENSVRKVVRRVTCYTVANVC